jgi:hypothetical protein
MIGDDPSQQQLDFDADSAGDTDPGIPPPTAHCILPTTNNIAPTSECGAEPLARDPDIVSRRLKEFSSDGF